MEQNIPSILVVDDNEIAYNAARKLLVKDGFKVDVAVDGVDAINKLVDGKYQLVITDLVMPTISGEKLIEAIRRNKFRRIKILVVSSVTNEAKVGQALAAGADDFLSKPYNPQELLTRVHKLLQESGIRLENSKLPSMI